MAEIDRILGAHEARLVNIEKKIDTIDGKLDPIIIYINKQDAINEGHKQTRDYWGLLTSGGVAAVIGSLVTWFFGSR